MLEQPPITTNNCANTNPRNITKTHECTLAFSLEFQEFAVVYEQKPDLMCFSAHVVQCRMENQRDHIIHGPDVVVEKQQCVMISAEVDVDMCNKQSVEALSQLGRQCHQSVVI